VCVLQVLGGGVANRWLTRLRPTDEWMAARQAPRTAGIADGSGGAIGGGEGEDGADDDELSAFFSLAVSRDVERALERGCSLEDLECEFVRHFGKYSRPNFLTAVLYLLHAVLSLSAAFVTLRSHAHIS
jgi:hypothetical protein